MSKPAVPLSHLIPERAFTAQVIELARRLKWRVAHFRPGKTQRGKWVTPVQGDGAGFPDLVMVRGNRIVFAELKAHKGKASPLQLQWIQALLLSGVEAYIWKPADFDEIERALR